MDSRGTWTPEEHGFRKSMSPCARACAHGPVRMSLRACTPTTGSAGNIVKTSTNAAPRGGFRFFFLRVLEEHGFQKNMGSGRTWIPGEHGFQKNMASRRTWILEEHEPVRTGLCA